MCFFYLHAYNNIFYAGVCCRSYNSSKNTIVFKWRDTFGHDTYDIHWFFLQLQWSSHCRKVVKHSRFTRIKKGLSQPRKEQFGLCKANFRFHSTIYNEFFYVRKFWKLLAFSVGKYRFRICQKYRYIYWNIHVDWWVIFIKSTMLRKVCTSRLICFEVFDFFLMKPLDSKWLHADLKSDKGKRVNETLSEDTFGWTDRQSINHINKGEFLECKTKGQIKSEWIYEIIIFPN